MVNLLHGNIALKKQLSNVIWTIIHSGQGVSKGILNTKKWLTTAASQIVGGNYLETTQKSLFHFKLHLVKPCHVALCSQCSYRGEGCNFELGGLHSTEVAFLLLTQQPRIRIPAQPRLLSTS